MCFFWNSDNELDLSEQAVMSGTMISILFWICVDDLLHRKMAESR